LSASFAFSGSMTLRFRCGDSFEFLEIVGRQMPEFRPFDDRSFVLGARAMLAWLMVGYTREDGERPRVVAVAIHSNLLPHVGIPLGFKNRIVAFALVESPDIEFIDLKNDAPHVTVLCGLDTGYAAAPRIRLPREN